MTTKFIMSLLILLVIAPTSRLYAEAALCIIPFKGDGNPQRLEQIVKNRFVEKGGIALVSDKHLKKIMEIHKKAQTMGSGYHDLSKMKVAEFILEGELSGRDLTISVVNVNTSSIIFSKTYTISGDDYSVKRAADHAREAVLMGSVASGREIPEDATEGMNLIKKLVSGLDRSDDALYPLIAVYCSGKYQHPDPRNQTMVSQAKTFLNAVRLKLVRAQVNYVSMEAKAPWTYIVVVADKSGTKSMHRFGIYEFTDGTVAIGIYNLLK